MDITAKHIYNLENSIARYIYKKYIHITNDNNEHEQIPDNENISNDDEHNLKEDNDNSSENKLYRLYIQNIFDLDRQSFRILQDDALKEDLYQMSIADKAYSLNPKIFNSSEYSSLPDILRCTYIRKHNHRYHRCKNKVIDDDNDTCKIHDNYYNIYLDNYNILVDTHTNK